MTILKVMFVVAIGTYIAYEMSLKKKNGSSGQDKDKPDSSYSRVPVSKQ